MVCVTKFRYVCVSLSPAQVKYCSLSTVLPLGHHHTPACLPPVQPQSISQSQTHRHTLTRLYTHTHSHTQTCTDAPTHTVVFQKYSFKNICRKHGFDFLTNRRHLFHSLTNLMRCNQIFTLLELFHYLLGTLHLLL